MKENWKVVVISVAATLVIAISCLVTFRSNKNITNVKLEFMTYDALEKKDTLDKTVIAKKNEVIDLGNDRTIKILEINEEGIKTSRDVIKYKVISTEEMRSEPYTDTIIENIKYGDTISIDVDEHDPFGPAYEQSRYYSYIKVVKEK